MDSDDKTPQVYVDIPYTPHQRPPCDANSDDNSHDSQLSELIDNLTISTKSPQESDQEQDKLEDESDALERDDNDIRIGTVEDCELSSEEEEDNDGNDERNEGSGKEGEDGDNDGSNGGNTDVDVERAENDGEIAGDNEGEKGGGDGGDANDEEQGDLEGEDGGCGDFWHEWAEFRNRTANPTTSRPGQVSGAPSPYSA